MSTYQMVWLWPMANTRQWYLINHMHYKKLGMEQDPVQTIKIRNNDFQLFEFHRKAAILNIYSDELAYFCKACHRMIWVLPILNILIWTRTFKPTRFGWILFYVWAFGQEKHTFQTLFSCWSCIGHWTFVNVKLIAQESENQCFVSPATSTPRTSKLLFKNGIGDSVLGPLPTHRMQKEDN